MAAESDHGRVIVTAAREELAPLGFWQKGKSRVWLVDRGFWLGVVEFQPSSFRKGSFLNVAAHWLWAPMAEVLSFNYSLRETKLWVEYRTSDQFDTEIKNLARIAAEKFQRLEDKIGSLHSLAILLSQEIESENEDAWSIFHAAVVTGAIGDMAKARLLFEKAQGLVSNWRADLAEIVAPYGEALGSDEAFHQFLMHKINAQRDNYKLGPWSFRAT